MRLNRLFKRRKHWYVGTVGDDRPGFRVSKREVMDAFAPLDCGTWDLKIHFRNPLLSGSIEQGYFSYRNPFYPDKRIKYWKGYPHGVSTIHEGQRNGRVPEEKGSNPDNGSVPVGMRSPGY